MTQRSVRMSYSIFNRSQAVLIYFRGHGQSMDTGGFKEISTSLLSSLTRVEENKLQHQQRLPTVASLPNRSLVHVYDDTRVLLYCCVVDKTRIVDELLWDAAVMFVTMMNAYKRLFR
eukprot:Lankesteria_metandrocarpae@DN499_c0_g1_i1.p2